MAADLRILDSDGTTVITSSDQGNIATPGNSTAKKFYVENIGTTQATEVTVSIEAFGTNDGSDYTYTAPDIAGSPGSFGQSDISLGTIAPLATSPFWVQITQPAGLTADFNPRRSNIVVAGLTI